MISIISYMNKSFLTTLPADMQQAYDYSAAVYTKALQPITGIVCHKHGVFQQYVGNLRKGTGCPQCGAEKRTASRQMPLEEFYSRCSELHKGKYQYLVRSYTNMTTKIPVVCPEHGEFYITPLKHFYSLQGCPACGAMTRGIRKSTANVGALAAATSIAKHAAGFIKRAQAIHGDIYDYSKVLYKGAKTEVTIICPHHGEFFQRPEKHLYEAQGCPRCGQKSKGEDAVAAYISKFTSVVRRDRTIITPKELDIVLPDHNIAIEYCGAYYHSSGTAEETRQTKYRHKQKQKAAEAAGYRLITLFDFEWEEHHVAIKRFLRNAIGRGRGKVMARKCDLQKVGVAEARAFYDKYHPQGGAGSGEHYGLYWNNKLVACMRFTLGANDRGSNRNRVWTLTRYATRITVTGGASKLFSAFLSEYAPTEVKSFSDNRLFSGGMYKQLGFVLEDESDPDYQVWSPKIGVRPKAHYQRRNIPQRLAEHGIEDKYDPDNDHRSEAEMTYHMKCRRLYDCGKKRWVWTRK